MRASGRRPFSVGALTRASGWSLFSVSALMRTSGCGRVADGAGTRASGCRRSEVKEEPPGAVTRPAAGDTSGVGNPMPASARLPCRSPKCRAVRRNLRRANACKRYGYDRYPASRLIEAMGHLAQRGKGGAAGRGHALGGGGHERSKVSHRLDPVQARVSHRLDPVQARVSHRPDPVQAKASHRLDPVPAGKSP
jgi:hypothetical protein